MENMCLDHITVVLDEGSVCGPEVICAWLDLQLPESNSSRTVELSCMNPPIEVDLLSEFCRFKSIFTYYPIFPHRN
jgi:hypothetical protein